MPPTKHRMMKLRHEEFQQAKAALERLEPRLIAGINYEPGMPEWAAALLEQAITAYNMGVRTHITPEEFRAALEVAK